MRLIETISLWTGKIASYMVILLMGILVYEVVVRNIFDKPTLGGYEAAGLLFGTYSIMLGAYAALVKGHVRMDAVYRLLKPKTQVRLDVITSFLIICFLIVFLWLAVTNALDSWSIKECSGTAWGPPLYPGKTVICIGVFVLLLQAVVNFIRNLMLAITGKETTC